MAIVTVNQIFSRLALNSIIMPQYCISARPIENLYPVCTSEPPNSNKSRPFNCKQLKCAVISRIGAGKRIVHKPKRSEKFASMGYLLLLWHRRLLLPLRLLRLIITHPRPFCITRARGSCCGRLCIRNVTECWPFQASRLRA